jgi:[ribosomal protein S5]-alanine N-acetyltransferase
MATLETARLILRPFTPDDVDAYVAVRRQPDVLRHFSPASSDPARQPEIARGLIERFIGHWRDDGYGPWAVIDKQSGKLIGHHGLRFMPEFGETEILYMLDSAFWRRGLASEAARAAIGYARDPLGLQRLMAIAVLENAGSLRVMAKAGFVFRRMAKYHGLDVAYHELELGDAPPVGD